MVVAEFHPLEDGTGTEVDHHAATVEPGVIALDEDVGQFGVGPVAHQYAAAEFGAVVADGAALDDHRRPFGYVDAAASLGPVARDHAVGEDRRRTAHGDDAAAITVVVPAVGVSAGDDDAVENGVLRRRDHVIGVVGRVVRRADVTAQDGRVPAGVALGFVAFITGEAADDGDSFHQAERGVAPPALRLVGPRRHPDAVAAARRRERRGQAPVGARPAAAVAARRAGPDEQGLGGGGNGQQDTECRQDDRVPHCFPPRHDDMADRRKWKGNADAVVSVA